MLAGGEGDMVFQEGAERGFIREDAMREWDSLGT